jgi:hypothetical protein
MSGASAYRVKSVLFPLLVKMDADKNYVIRRRKCLKKSVFLQFSYY